jgi:hypothetical protein
MLPPIEELPLVPEDPVPYVEDPLVELPCEVPVPLVDEPPVPDAPAPVAPVVPVVDLSVPEV